MMLCTMIILQRKFFKTLFFYEIWNGNEGYFFGRRRFMPYSLAAVCAKPSSLHFMFFAGLSKNSWQMMLTSPDLSWAQEKRRGEKVSLKNTKLQFFAKTITLNLCQKKLSFLDLYTYQILRQKRMKESVTTMQQFLHHKKLVAKKDLFQWRTVEMLYNFVALEDAALTLPPPAISF